ncbi:thiamine-phosphate kinase [Alcanivorax sediminis]|uniref:Thiamine-monophosphate kinase n=1 Tax=Alcanivorax sediminis TaxID=2663008 RepID=A0A6N7LRL4_9GAMM|nr:thiamine-phosphate kinase [Alcanivorax sediminis]MQX52893.1 thiamine-phosphate kinase [Alcanivorax sediminis]
MTSASSPDKPLDEFSLIRRYFHHAARLAGQDASVVLGPGDDAALLTPPAGHQLVMTQDTSLEGRHFPDDMAASDVGYRCLAVNLSDLAAMGATPLWFLLSLTLPEVNEAWLADFSRGMFELADASGIALVGGDITRGPLAISIQATGAVPAGQALLRSGARVGDVICLGGVTGAGLHGLHLWQQGVRQGPAIAHFRRPQPQLALGLALRGVATACIDLSDGLLADLNHVLMASGGLGARLEEACLPLDAAILRDCPHDEQRRLQLQGGDDYLLLFTLPQGVKLPEACFAIGRVEEQSGIRLLTSAGETRQLEARGWQHFG